jgi:hypothetical protein
LISRILSYFFLFLKLADCGGMVLEEQPAKLAEALRYFLQGLGFGKVILFYLKNLFF